MVSKDDQSKACELVGEWEALYDWLFRGPSTAPRGRDFRGWTSAYDGSPIADAVMLDWQATALRTLRGFRPQSVLEIGAGTGLILSHLAPECETYVATDLSGSVVAGLKQLVRRHDDLRHVELLVQPAHRCSSIARHFDTIILNSVVQYFPSAAYLTDVLLAAIGLLRPGGRIFVGDVRNPRTHALYLSSIRQERELRQLPELAAGNGELLVDPAYFSWFCDVMSPGAKSDAHLKRSPLVNELSVFRYDVVLLKPPFEHGGPIRELGGSETPLDEVTRVLETHPTGVTVLRDLPNPRLAKLLGWDLDTGIASFHAEALNSFAERLGLELTMRDAASASAHLVDIEFAPRAPYHVTPPSQQGGGERPPLAIGPLGP